ncbi:MAG: OmpH family outer membrane protein [Planctomycetes bacterium]|nr:OmpH family outer membrane protein [Planctomycetota bacterium]
MKRAFLIGTLAAVGALAAVALSRGSGGLLAQGTSPAGTKVAVVNVGQVFAKYKKAEMYKLEMDGLLQPFREQEKKLKAGYEAWQNFLPKATTAEDRAKCQQGLLDHKRAIEDLQRTIQEKVGKRQAEQITTLYHDVSNAVEAYAKANGIHLVLAFGEQIDGADVFNFPNINRKMQGMDLGSAHPIFFHGSSDISSAVISILNQGVGTVPGVPTSQKKN